MSVTTGGHEANGGSGYPAMSGDGRLVVFVSAASNLVPGDTNGYPDVFVHDRDAGVTWRVSVGSVGNEANSLCAYPAISGDGRVVAFASAASNLVPGDSNGAFDVFVHEIETGVTSRVSIDSNGVQGNGGSYAPSLSADGRYVAFYSWASNLVAGDTNELPDVFVHDRITGTTTRESVGGQGIQANGGSYLVTISANGQRVAFHSNASNLVPGDTNGMTDVFVRDRAIGSTERVSVSSAGIQGNGASINAVISGDGHTVAFRSSATNLVVGDTNGVADIFVRQLTLGVTVRVSVSSEGTQADGSSDLPVVSENGRFVAFLSDATNLVEADTNGLTDVLLRDVQRGRTYRLNVASDGAQANGGSVSLPAIDQLGRYVAFQSAANNLIPMDTNVAYDVFLAATDGVPPWDVNGDGICDISDVAQVVMRWQEVGSPGWIPEDVNRDGIVDISDIAVLGLHWLETW